VTESRLRIATRRSRLALWQSEHAASRLREAHSGLHVELLPMSTRGDEVLDRSLAEVGGKGLFLKELERALLNKRADLAVHSLKDVPAENPDGLVLAAVLPRANWADLWLTRDGSDPGDLPAGSRVGTSSLRRQSQLLRRYPHLDVVAVRGNVETRIGKMTSGAVDAVVLASAGIDRLGLEPEHRRPLMPPDFLPAPAQGVIVLQCRRDDRQTRRRLAVLDCPETRMQVEAERAVVKRLGADCRMPLAALAERCGRELRLAARLARPDGSDCIDVSVKGAPERAQALGEQAAGGLLELGAMRILSQI
jgi:hydroxymethylbilane synthase